MLDLDYEVGEVLFAFRHFQSEYLSSWSNLKVLYLPSFLYPTAVLLY